MGSHNATTSGEPNDIFDVQIATKLPGVRKYPSGSQASTMPLENVVFLEYPASILPKVTMRRKCINYPKSWPNATVDGQHNDPLDVVATFPRHFLLHLPMLRKCINVSGTRPMPRRSGGPIMPRQRGNVDATQEHQCMHKFKPVNALASSPNAAQIGSLSGQFLRFCLSLSHALNLDIDIDRQEHKDRLRTGFVRL
ncbi:hypothetical protein EV121DRAFT_273839 [Schizophyllum commune]